MKRYLNTGVKRDKSGVRVYNTTFYPTIPIDDSDQFIYTKFGDRIDALANQYYGDVTLWWIISKANGIKGQAGLKPGLLLRIPGNITQIISDFNALNSGATTSGGTSSGGSGGTGDSSGGGTSGGGSGGGTGGGY
jgi:uncharacterized membrane protein YgcG